MAQFLYVPDYAAFIILTASFIIFFLVIILDLLFNSTISGFLVTILLKLFFWFRKSKDYIKVGSMSFSLLGGKIPFRDVVYVTKNATLHIIDGYISFNWWYIFKPKWEGSESIIVIHFSGFEYIIFNNQAAYEKVEDLKKKREDGIDTEIELDSSPPKQDGRKNFFSWVKGAGLIIRNGTIIIGNNKLPTHMSISFKKASGIFKLDKPKSSIDNYRFMCDLKVEKFQYSYPKNPNVEYETPFYENLDDLPLKEAAKKHFSKSGTNLGFLDFDFDSMQNNEFVYPFNYKYPENCKTKMKIPNETTIISIKSVRFTYYDDSPGLVPTDKELRKANSEPPKCGIDIVTNEILGDGIVYGPWADHQRYLIQTFFYPPTHENQKRIYQTPGSLRQHERFDINIEFKKPTTWWFPFHRRPRNLEEKLTGKCEQEAFNFSFSEGSTILWSYCYGQIDETGSNTLVDINLKKASCSTSNTNSPFGSAPNFRFQWDMHTAAPWNGFRNYTFDMDIEDGKVFFLYDHLVFIQDLVYAWRNYPNKTWPPDIKEFYPSLYKYMFRLHQSEILININDNNIIDSHNEYDRNTYFCIRAPIFELELVTDYPKFDPVSSVYEIYIRMMKKDDVLPKASIRLPSNHPMTKNLGNTSTEFISGDKVTLSAKYLMHTHIAPENLDSITIDISAEKGTFTLTGFYLNYIVGILYNLLTSEKFFVSTEEFKLNGNVNEKGRYIYNLRNTDEKGHLLPSNSTEYFLSVDARSIEVVAPLNLYSTKESIGTGIIEKISVDLRYVPTYIDLSVDVSPISISIPLSGDDLKIKHPRQTFLGLEAVKVWGHAMVGTPPDNNYYKMIFDILIGNVKGELFPSQVTMAINFLTNFIHQWKVAYPITELSSLPKIYNNDRVYMPDIVSKYKLLELLLKIESITCGIIGTNGIVNISVPKGVEVFTDNMVDSETGSRHYVEVPEIDAKLLNSRELGMKTKEGDWIKIASLETGIRLDIRSRPPCFRKHQKLHTKFLRDQDSTTMRLNIWNDEKEEKEGSFVESMDLEEIVKESTTQVTERTDDETSFFDVDTHFDEKDQSDDEYASAEDEDDQPTQSTLRGSVRQPQPNKRNSVSRRSHNNRISTSNSDVLSFRDSNASDRFSSGVSLDGSVGDDDEDSSTIETVFFYKGEKKNMTIPLSTYEKYLMFYVFEYDRDENTPLYFNSKNIFLDHKFGLYSYFPDYILKRTNGLENIEKIYKHYVPPIPLIKMTEERREMKQTKAGFLEKSEIVRLTQDDDRASTNIHLNFSKDISVFLTPNVCAILQDFIKPFITPKQNCEDIADTLEKRNYESETTPETIPDWNLNMYQVSCSLNSATVHLLQSIYAPDLIKSNFLGSRTTHSVKFVGSSLFFVMSVGFKNNRVLDDPEVPLKELVSVEGSGNLKTLYCTMQVINKKGLTSEAIPIEGFPKAIEFVENCPTLLVLYLDGLDLFGKYKVTLDENQGRVSVTTGKGVRIDFVKELPAIIYSMFDIWKHAATSIGKTVTDSMKQSSLAEIYFLSSLVALSQNRNISTFFEENKTQAIKKMREILNVVPYEEFQKINKDLSKKGFTNSINQDTDVEFFKVLMKTSSDQLPAQNPEDQVVKRKTFPTLKHLRTDVFFKVDEVKISLHASKTTSVVKVNDILVQGKLEYEKLNTQKEMEIEKKKLKKRKIEALLSVQVALVSVNIYPEFVPFITCILGVQALLWSDQNKELVGKLREQTMKRTKSIVDQYPEELEFSDVLSNVQRATSPNKFVIYIGVELDAIEARAWMDSYNFAELIVDGVSVMYNQALKGQDISRSVLGTEGDPKEVDLKLVHSSSVNISKIKVQYNYSAEKLTSFTSLFDASIHGISINEYWFKINSKKNISLVFGVKGIQINVPYTKIWKAATFQFRRFINTWYTVITARPNVPSTINQKTLVNLPKGEDGKIKINTEIPAISIYVDVNNLGIEAILLPNLQMRYEMKKIIVSFSRSVDEMYKYHLHLSNSYLAFKTNPNEEFPNNEREIPNPQQTNHSTDFRKKIILPEVIISGDVKTETKSKQPSVTISTFIDVEYMENVFTSDLLNNVMHIQSTLLKEVNNVIEGFNYVIDPDDKERVATFTNKIIKTDLPKAQSTVKTWKVNYDINLSLEGINITALTKTTSVIFNTGRMKVSISQFSNSGMKISLDISKLHAEMVDSYSMKFSTKRVFDEAYSDYTDCYHWGHFETNIIVRNFNSQTSEIEEENITIEESSSKLMVFISDTHATLRPGLIDQASIFVADYASSINNLRQAIQKNEDLQTEAITTLMKKGEEYYNYYSKQIVEQVSKVPTLIKSSGLVKITNTTVSFPIGDNPYYGFLANEYPSFQPTESLQIVIDLVKVSTNAHSEEMEGKNYYRRNGIFKIENIGIYFEDVQNYLKKGVPRPSLDRFELALNKCKIEKGIVRMQFISRQKSVKTTIDCNISGPQVDGDASMAKYILHIREDWVNSRRNLYNDPLKFIGSQDSKESQKVGKEVVDLILGSIHVQGAFKIEPGTIRLHSSLMKKTDTIFNSIKSRRDHTISLEADLPSLIVDVVYTSAEKKTNTHLQLSVDWVGGKLYPQSVLFYQESLYIYNYSVFEMKKNKKLQKDLTNVKKPQNWMNLLAGIIKIQKIYRGYSAKKLYKKMKSGNITNRKTEKKEIIETKKDKKDHDVSLQTETYSFHCRIRPFKIELSCAPVIEVSTFLEFTQPFDLLITRSNRSLSSGNIKGDAIYLTVFLSSPEIVFGLTHNLSPPEFAVIKLIGFKGNIGTGYGNFLRSDDTSVICGIIHLEKFMINISLPQINHFFIMYTLIMSKLDEAKKEIKQNYETPQENEISQNIKNIASQVTNKKKVEELSLDATPSIFLQALINDIQLNSDLGSSVGKQKIRIINATLSLRDRGRFKNSILRDPFVASGNIEKVMVNLIGRLKGAYSMGGVALGITRKFRVAGKNPIIKGITDFWIVIQPMSLDMDYNTDKILNIKTGELSVRLKNVLDTPTGKEYHSKIQLLGGDIILRMSRLTAPAFLKLFFRLKDNITDGKESAIEMIKTSLNFKGTLSFSDSENELTIKSLPIAIQTPKEMLVNLLAAGEFSLICSNVSVFVYDKFDIKKDELIPFGSWIDFCSGKFTVTLAREIKRQEEEVVRLLTIFLANLKVDKKDLRKSSLVIGIPGCLLEMKSNQSIHTDEIVYIFDSKFPKPIQVSTNLSDYNFLRELIESFTTEIKKATEETLTSKNNGLSMLTDEEIDQENKIKIQERKIFPERNFVGTIELNPQLSVLGDMTPKISTVLSWWGIKDNAVIPRATHDTLTNILETIFVGSYNGLEVFDKVFEEKQNQL